LTEPELADDYSVSWSGLPAGVPELHAVVADFTGDGRADLAYSFNGNLKLLEFVPGQPGLTLRSSTNPFGSPSNVVEGLLEIDANGDATPDFLAWRGDTIKLIEIAACQPTATQTYIQGIVDHHMPAMGDVDLDGDLDLVIWDMSRYVLLRRTGAATWSIEPPVTGGPAEFLVDVDEDGDLDGVCCGSGDPETPENILTSTFRVSVNDGTGAFASAIETNWLGSDHLAGIADLDRDGDLDVVSGRCILYARGPLTQRLHPLLGSQQTDRSTADIDGDSDADFTVGLRTMQRNLGEGLCSSYGASFPAPPPETQFVGPGWPGDFDGDGDVDLVVDHNAGSTLLAQRLLVNLGGGAFADAGDAGPSGVDFNPGPNQGSYWDSSLAGDADGDGDIDLITRGTARSPYQSFVWWNDGAGHFTAGPGFPDEFINGIDDLNGDGIPDVTATWLAYPGASYGDSGWQEGLGGGAFGPRVTLSSASFRIVVADLDADGDLDLAIANLGLNVYWNNGGGVFTTEWVSSITLSNGGWQRVWSADVDDDGRLDLLVTGSERERNGVIVLSRRRTTRAGRRRSRRSSTPTIRSTPWCATWTAMATWTWSPIG